MDQDKLRVLLEYKAGLVLVNHSKPALPTWTDICSCNICIHHIPVDYVGKGREHDCMDAGGRATQEQLPRSGSFELRNF
ncbi:hypothetical protein Mettu_3695 [Methylobacter tundripaludum SV96]|uniref:Uncharacterized protein n=1 Tax=Methylobacter tundripaludum (strain ATCC BAA-1195 / DSM 17260 / SV96) TaxID=697282 RepID=G3J027_METTV|nr:hypothetical protein Mettu_3695 [Methylobacter tundripaludum SV96]